MFKSTFQKFIQNFQFINITSHWEKRLVRMGRDEL